jgi:hypothetical protein
MDAPTRVWNGSDTTGTGLVPLHVFPSMGPLYVWKRDVTKGASHSREKIRIILFLPTSFFVGPKFDPRITL